MAFGAPSWLRRGLAGPQHRHHAHRGSHAVSNAVFHAYRQAVFHQHWLAHRNAVVAAHRRAASARRLYGRQPSVHHGYHPRPSERTALAQRPRRNPFAGVHGIAHAAIHHPGFFESLGHTASHGLSDLGNFILQHHVGQPSPFPSGPSSKGLSAAAHGFRSYAHQRAQDPGYFAAARHNQTLPALAHLVAHPGKAAHGLTRSQQTYLGVSGTNATKGLNLATAPYHIGKALIQHPSALGKTARDLGYLAIGAPAGIVQAAADPVGAVRGLSKDFSRRYGPLMAGHAGAFEKRIAKEGAAAEAVDIASFGAGQGFLLGRGLGRTARSGILGERLQRVAAEPRPHLRVSGGKVKPQKLSPNLIRVAAQRYEDRLRAQHAARRDAQGQLRGLQPQRGQRPSGRPRVVTPLFRSRAQRVAVSATQAPRYHGFVAAQHAEIDRGARRALARLRPGAQRDAAWYVLHGIVTPHDPIAAVRQLTEHRAKIIDQFHAARAVPAKVRRAYAEGKLTPAAIKYHGLNHLPPEVSTIDRLIAHPEVFNEKLAKFHTGELARHERLGHSAGVRDTTAEARRYRPQAHSLGIEYPYLAQRDTIHARATSALRRANTADEANAIKATRDQALQDLEARRPQLDRQFVTQVRQEAAKAGLPEPVYVQHFGLKSEAERRYARTLGGRRAQPSPKESRLERGLFAQGRADVRPIAYLESLARQMRRGHNWASVAAQAEEHVMPSPTRFELQQVFGHRHVSPKDLTAYQWQQVLEHRGWNPNDWRLWSPGRMRAHVVNSTTEQAGAVGQRVNEATQAIDHAFVRPGDETVKDTGFKLVPKAVYDEIHAGAGGLGTGGIGRTLGKAMGFQSRLLLGANPGWFQVQVAANAFLSGFGTHGNVAEFVKAPAFWRTLSPEVKKQAEDLFGVGIAHGHGERVHLGAAAGDSAIINGYRAWRDAVAFKAAAGREHIPILRNASTLNPFDITFALDDLNNAYFKKTVLYSEAKRRALADIRKEMGIAAEAHARIASIFTLGPQERIRALLSNKQTLEQLGQATNNILGDYARYTARERNVIKRSVLFYGFMRYSLRTLFYTLPVQHPLVAALAAKLAQLHNQEVAQLLGGPDAPWAYSRIFLSDSSIAGSLRNFPLIGHFFQKVPGTNLWSIDFARLNPVTNPIVGVATEGVKSFGGFLSPAMQSLSDQLYGRRLYTGQGFRVHGKATEAKSIDAATRARIVAQDFLSQVWGYRAAQQMTQRGTQGDEAMLGLPAPLHFKTPQALAKERQRRAAQGNPLDVFFRQFEPFAPRPDFTRTTVQNIRKAKGKPGARGGGGGSAIDNAIDRTLNLGGGSSLDEKINRALK